MPDMTETPAPTALIHHGDVLAVLRGMPEASVDLVATSPPYYNLRDYHVPPTPWADGTEGCLGLEDTVEAYVRHLTEVSGEIHRVLKPTGTFYLNIADCYALKGTHTEPVKYAAADAVKPRRGGQKGLHSKCLLLVPEQVALAFRAAGWIIRQKNVWHKPNGMCSSTRDNTTSVWEMVFMCVKEGRYWYDKEAVAEPLAKSSLKRYQRVIDTGEVYDPTRHKTGPQGQPSPMEVLTRGAAGVMARGTRNRRNVWTIPTQPFAGAHFACWPERLVEIMVKASCPPGGMVLDPFSGSGRTGLVATRLGRHFTGIDANAGYCQMAASNIRGSR